LSLPIVRCSIAGILAVGHNASPMSADGLRAAEEKMRAAGEGDEAVRAFKRAYQRLEAGESAFVASAELEPASDVPLLDELPASAGSGALARVATIKLNGGLATTMGLRRAKSLMEARDGRSFLELIVGQTLALRERYGIQLPLVLMDSESTRADTLAALGAYPSLAVDGLALDFLQSMIPKLDAESLMPVQWPAAPALEWCPPGHGDVYGALRRSGMLAALLDRGFDYAMISNSDNLGATLEPRIAEFLVAEGVPFLIEVIEGTEAERKGGHIARRHADGQLVLREVAQTPPEDQDSFRDYRRWRYYNTNNLWVDLRALSELLEASSGSLDLPLIVNRKTVDPRDPSSPAVLQLESAMGAAIASFPGARVVCVPRTRFAPVKTTDDLLVLRSDVYQVGEGMLVEPVPERTHGLPYVELDPGVYKLLDAFEARFPDGAPSLREAARLVVHGDVTFSGGVVVRGSVEIESAEPTVVAPGTVLEG
jgi:UTP--glucose-1-phosphate uridylyltransferase